MSYVRWIFSRVIMIFVILPVLPFWCLHMIANWLHRFVDMCVVDRKWSTAIADASDKIADWGDNRH